MKKNTGFAALLLSFVLLVVSSGDALAVTKAELQKKVEENQNKLNTISSGIASLEDEQDLIEEAIDDTNAELINLYTEIGVLEDQIAETEQQIREKEEEIEEAQQQYEAALAEENRQYEAMKKRIQYMYETGQLSYVELLMNSTSFSDMLNKAEYIDDLYAYDRKMLTEYQGIREDVEDLQALLDREHAELEASKSSLEEDKKALADQQNYLNGILAQKKAESKKYDEEIAAAKKQANAYKSQIAADRKKIAQMEEEERRQLAAKNGKLTVSTGNSAYAGTIASAQAIVAAASGSSTGKKIASYACQFIGNPYVAGGTSLTNGADCSGFIFRLYSDFGYRVPRTSYSLRSVGTGVSLAEAQPGDVVCYEGHVAMYIGSGMIVHASSKKTGIKVSNAQYKPILTVRRIL